MVIKVIQVRPSLALKQNFLNYDNLTISQPDAQYPSINYINHIKFSTIKVRYTEEIPCELVNPSTIFPYLGR
ncbi:hypothetical protein A4R26_25640 [Niastella populi]|uniref:Uncharacterized protein n=1 Tax=Niastella populi TaxID=550983 RepID=A0A1V9FEF2_9BACT|nr:hypothetical protein A4R26_25640 [Niastella populi]